MLITKMLLVVIDLHSMERKIDNSILQNSIFCAQQKKEDHTGLEQHEDEEMMTEFSFLGELSLYANCRWIKKTKEELVILVRVTIL